VRVAGNDVQMTERPVAALDGRMSEGEAGERSGGVGAAAFDEAVRNQRLDGAEPEPDVFENARGVMNQLRASLRLRCIGRRPSVQQMQIPGGQPIGTTRHALEQRRDFGRQRRGALRDQRAERVQDQRFGAQFVARFIGGQRFRSAHGRFGITGESRGFGDVGGKRRIHRQGGVGTDDVCRNAAEPALRRRQIVAQQRITDDAGDPFGAAAHFFRIVQQRERCFDVPVCDAPVRSAHAQGAAVFQVLAVRVSLA